MNPVTSTSLFVVVPGKPVTNNLVTRSRGAGAPYKNPRSRAYQQRVAACALEAAIAAHWISPPCARVDIVVINHYIDADNAAKTAVDALRGIAIVDDNRTHMRAISVEHAIDDVDPEPRIHITIEPCEPLPLRSRKRKRQ